MPLTPAPPAPRSPLRSLPRSLGRADVPGFVLEVPEETRKLVQKSIVPDEALETASVPIQMFPRLEQVSGTSAPKLRDAFGFALACGPVAREAFAFALSVAHTIRVQRAAAGASALDISVLLQAIAECNRGEKIT